MKKTKINKAHHMLKGKLVDFAGWELPVQYTGLSQEHNAVRTTCGLFDVSHMGEIRFKGPQALEAVQHFTSNNVAKLKPGKIHYSGLMTEKGTFVDDLLVYMISDTEYFLVVNASNLEKDYNYMKEKAGHFDVTITNESEEYSQIAIQGPNAEALLAEFTDTDLAPIKYYYFTFGSVNGHDMLISRTGYTGEDGFEIYFKSDEETASNLFMELAEKGKAHGIVPAGLGARDTLRLESGMALYGNDIDDSHTILEANLGWILKLRKGDFIGKDALLKQKEEGITRKLVGFEMTGRGIARHGYPVYVEGEPFDTVCSGTWSPTLKKAIGMTYLPIDKCETGSGFQIGIRDKMVTAKVVETPFYKRDK
ncbi:MAG: glycine cleavage system aminomethyltransferase GcvT [bacterium]|nr:glycine cleavage system aminomethyltransferase GcvT [bacterium]